MSVSSVSASRCVASPRRDEGSHAAIASASATVRCAISACSRSTMRPSSWIAPLSAFSGLLEGGDDRLRPRQLALVRREDRIGGRDLARGGSASCQSKPRSRRLLAFGPEAGLVLDVVIDAVEDVDAMGAGGQERRSSARAASAPGPAAKRARVSLARSLVPSTKQARRVRRLVRGPGDALAASRMASGVSIIAQTLIAGAAQSPFSWVPMRCSVSGEDTLRSGWRPGLASVAGARDRPRTRAYRGR